MRVKCVSQIFTLFFNHLQSLYFRLEISQLLFVKCYQLLIRLSLYSRVNWFLQEGVLSHVLRFFLLFHFWSCLHSKIFWRALKSISRLLEFTHITESHFFDLSHRLKLISFSFESIAFSFGSSIDGLFLKRLWFFVFSIFRTFPHGVRVVIVIVEMIMILTVFRAVWFFPHWYIYCYK